MFHVLGSLTDTDFAGEERTDIFSHAIWLQPGSQRMVLQQQKLTAVCLRRRNESPESDFFTGRGWTLIVVGQAYRRKWAAGEGNGRATFTARELLDGFLSNGSGFLQSVKGEFSLAIVKHGDGQHLLISSRFAIYPLYYTVFRHRLVFSTSLTELVWYLGIGSAIDPAAVLELLLFGHPLRDRTFFRGIRRLEGSTIVRVSLADSSCEAERYWDARLLYERPLLKSDEALEMGTELFADCVRQRVVDHTRACVAFTAGFDSRAIQAVLPRERLETVSYAFGLPGSLNVEIPRRLCAEQGYRFLPFYLDGDYEHDFPVYAEQAVLLSDGMVLQRANYPYVFSRLSQFSDLVLTGIFGSELLRSFQNLGLMVSETFARINRSTTGLRDLPVFLKAFSQTTYFDPDLLKEGCEETLQDLETWFDWARGFTSDQRFYLYLLTEGARKYFSTEVCMQSPFVTNQFPYLDDDFVEFVFAAPFAGVHLGALKPSPQDRLRSQLFYAHIIRKFAPGLMSYSTDHGYPPSDLFRPAALLRVGVKHLISRVRRRVSGYREFRSEELVDRFFQLRLNAIPDPMGVCSPLFSKRYEEGVWREDYLHFVRAATTRTWLAMVTRNLAPEGRLADPPLVSQP